MVCAAAEEQATEMKRGEIWWVDFDPSIGSEVKKRRPAVIISNDASNAAQSRVQVVPLMSASGRIYPWEAPVQLGRTPSKAMADQVRTVAKAGLSSRAGATSARELRAIENAVRFQLGL
jgi:mRNA interferase MazF